MWVVLSTFADKKPEAQTEQHQGSQTQEDGNDYNSNEQIVFPDTFRRIYVTYIFKYRIPFKSDTMNPLNNKRIRMTKFKN